MEQAAKCQSVLGEGAKVMLHQSTNGSERGFSVLEVMLAMVLLLIGVVGLAGIFAQGIRGNLSAADQSAATAFAEERIEQLEKQGFSYVKDNATTITSSEVTKTVNAGTAANPQAVVVYKATTALTFYDAAGNVTAATGSPVRTEIKVTATPAGKTKGAVTIAKHVSKAQ